MSDSPLSVQRSQLNAQAVAGWLASHYALPTPLTCQFWHRSINDVYLVQAAAHRFILRVSPAGWRDEASLVAEVALLQFLAQRNIVVPEPIQRQDGRFQATVPAPEGLRPAILFRYLPGKASLPDIASSHQFGAAIGRLHQVTDGYPSGSGLPQFNLAEMLTRPLARLEPLFSQDRSDWELLQQTASQLERLTVPLPAQPPYHGLCHGDVNNGNFLLTGPEDWALLDFEYSGTGWRIFDIATFYNNQIIGQGRSEQTYQMLDAFLNGYQAVRPLAPEEIDLLPAFVLLRQVWLLGVAARNRPLISQSQWEGWLQGQVMPFIREWRRRLQV